MARFLQLALVLFVASLVASLVGCNSESSSPAPSKNVIADQEALQREALKTLTPRKQTTKLERIKN